MLKFLNYGYQGNGEAYAASLSINFYNHWHLQEPTMSDNAISGVKHEMTSNILLHGEE